MSRRENPGIRVIKHHAGEGGCDNRRIIIEVEGDASIRQFQELVQRATNLWPDAHPEVKEFADIVTEGRVLQDYKTNEAYKLNASKKD
jgi:hypothetical protein